MSARIRLPLRCMGLPLRASSSMRLCVGVTVGLSVTPALEPKGVSVHARARLCVCEGGDGGVCASSGTGVLGAAVGSPVGTTVGTTVGSSVGSAVGSSVGSVMWFIRIPVHRGSCILLL